MRRSRSGPDDSTAIQPRPDPGPGLESLPGALHPVVRRVLAARRVAPSQLDPALRHLLPVSGLPGVDAAAARLVRAREAGERVLVVGDFDADGATASALAVTCLQQFGFRDPGFLVPDRFSLGYGLSAGVVDLAARRQPDLLVTVDNGITSHQGVRRARELGLEVLITDHHLPGPSLPEGALVVNPNLPGCGFGSPALCGVGVAFYLMAATGRLLAGRGLVTPAAARDVVTGCLDLVALGTVADLVPLDFNNRILVGEGLRRIRAGRSRPGLLALFRVAGRDPALARAADLGYAVAPRLNAAGRLDDMSIGIACLLADDLAEAQRLAVQLDALNTERRELQERMQGEAELMLDELPGVARGAAGACLFDERWHPGIVGLVASRIREITGAPAVAFARAAEPGLLRGSARSVDGVHVRDVIAAALARLPDDDVRFGGHAMAAGLTLPEAQLPAFRAAFAESLGRAWADAPERDVLWTDGPLESGELGLETAEALAAAGPWGQGFPEPLFDNHFLLREQRVVGGRHLRLRVQHPEGGPLLDAVAFGRPPLAAGEGASLRLVYRLDVNTFRASTKAQLVVEHLDCV